MKGMEIRYNDPHSLFYRRHRDCLEFGMADDVGVKHRVRGIDHLDGAGVDLLDASEGNDIVAEHGRDIQRAAHFEGFGQIHEGASGNGKIVYDEAVLALHIANDLQHLGIFSMIRTGLIANGDGQIQGGGILVRLLGITCVRRNHNHVFRAHALDHLGQHGRGIQVIHGALKEALQLLRMQIHGDKAVCAGQLHAFSTDARANGHARLILLIALAITKIGHDQGNGMRIGALKGIHPEQDFHKLIVGTQTDRLYQKHIAVTHGFIDTHKGIALRKGDDLRRTQLLAHVTAHAFRKDPTAATCEN